MKTLNILTREQFNVLSAMVNLVFNSPVGKLTDPADRPDGYTVCIEDIAFALKIVGLNTELSDIFDAQKLDNSFELFKPASGDKKQFVCFKYETYCERVNGYNARIANRADKLISGNPFDGLL